MMSKGLWNLPPQLRNHQKSHNGCRGISAWSPKRPLREAVKVKPRLPWSLWILEASDQCYLPGKAADKKWNQLKYVTVNNSKRVASKPFDTRHGVTGLVICPAGFQSSFGLLFSHWFCNITFWNTNVYSVSLYDRNVQFAFSGGYNYETASEFRRDSDLTFKLCQE